MTDLLDKAIKAKVITENGTFNDIGLSKILQKAGLMSDCKPFDLFQYVAKPKAIPEDEGGGMIVNAINLALCFTPFRHATYTTVVLSRDEHACYGRATTQKVLILCGVVFLRTEQKVQEIPARDFTGLVMRVEATKKG